MGSLINSTLANVIIDNYPDKIEITAHYDEELGKWLATIFLINDDNTRSAMLFMDKTKGAPGYETEDAAIRKMEDVILELAIKIEEHLNGYF